MKNLQQQNPNLLVEETSTDENGQQTIQITVKDSSIEDVRKLFKDQSQTRDFQAYSSLDTLLTEGLTEEQEQQIQALLKSEKFNEEFERFDNETMFACANVVLRYGNDEQKQKVIEFLKRNYNIAETSEVPEATVTSAPAPSPAPATPPFDISPLTTEELKRRREKSLEGVKKALNAAREVVDRLRKKVLPTMVENGHYQNATLIPQYGDASYLRGKSSITKCRIQGGEIIITNNGNADKVTIKNGGGLTLENASSAKDVVVRKGGSLALFHNTSATNVEVERGGNLELNNNSSAIARVDKNASISIIRSLSIGESYYNPQLLLLQGKTNLPNNINITSIYSQPAYLPQGITRETIYQAAKEENIGEIQPNQAITLDSNKPIVFKVNGKKYVIIPTMVRRKNQGDQSGYAVARVDDKGNLWLEGIFTSEEIKNNKSLTLKNEQKITLTIAAE